MVTQPTFAEALDDLDLGPISVEIEKLGPPGGADAYLTLVWDDDPVPFVADFKNARDRRPSRMPCAEQGSGRKGLHRSRSSWCPI